MTGVENTEKAPPFAIFRARDAVDYAEAEVMSAAPQTPEQAEQSRQMIDAGMLEGSSVRLLFSRPGMSLSYAWFKSGFPLPRHSHDADCLYFIVAGSLRIGTEELGPGDGFFIGTDVPYTYTPGEGGVEVLEFRTSNQFDIKMFGTNAAYCQKIIETLGIQRGLWESEVTPPSGMKIG